MKNSLLQFFSSLSSLEEKNGIVKQVLLEKTQFNIFPVFQHIDRSDKGFIDFSDLQFLLGESSRSADLNLVLETWSNCGKIFYREFVRWVFPFSSLAKPENQSFLPIPHDLKYSVQRVFQREIEFLKDFEDLAHETKKHIQGDYLAVFDLVSKGKNSFSQEDLLDFLRENGANVPEDLVYSVIRRLDKDSDGKVSLSDFIDSFKNDKDFANLGDQKPSQNLSNKTRDTITESQRAAPKAKKKPQNNLKNILKAFISQEKALQASRNEIALQLDFNVESAFSLFDKNNKKAVTEIEFEKGLQGLGIRTSSNSIFLIFQHYDEDADGLIELKDFSEILASSSPSQRSLLKHRNDKRKLSIETKAMLTQVFLKVIELEQNAEKIRRETERERCSLNDLLRVLDKKRKGKIDANEFRDVLKKYRIGLSKNDLDSLVSRFDKKEEGNLKFSEFASQLVLKLPRAGC